MEEKNRIKYDKLVDALRNNTQGQGILGYIHHQSKMYGYEKVEYILPKLKDWQKYLKKNQDIQVFYNFHKDLGKDLVRVHLVYQPNEHIKIQLV
jgi:hypothetical protein